VVTESGGEGGCARPAGGDHRRRPAGRNQKRLGEVVVNEVRDSGLRYVREWAWEDELLKKLAAVHETLAFLGLVWSMTII